MVSNIFHFHTYLGNWSNLTSICFKWVGSTTNKRWSVEMSITNMVRKLPPLVGHRLPPCVISRIGQGVREVLQAENNGRTYMGFTFFWPRNKWNYGILLITGCWGPTSKQEKIKIASQKLTAKASENGRRAPKGKAFLPITNFQGQFVRFP